MGVFIVHKLHITTVKLRELFMYKGQVFINSAYINMGWRFDIQQFLLKSFSRFNPRINHLLEKLQLKD